MHSTWLIAGLGQTLMGMVLFLMALFLILLVLIQRGRGGGLAGAFGGLGGQSAFGTRAGDTFTKITIVTAGLWILLSVVAVKFLARDTSKLAGGGSGIAVPADMELSDEVATPPGGSDPEGGPALEGGGETGGVSAPATDSSAPRETETPGEP